MSFLLKYDKLFTWSENVGVNEQFLHPHNLHTLLLGV